MATNQNQLTIEVEKRDVRSTNANRRLRAEGLVPAVVYGGGRDTVAIQVPRKALTDLLKKSGSEHPLFLLRMAGTGQERHALIRDMQIDPVTRQVQHVDFQRVVMTEKVRVQVPIELTGTAYGVKTEGGIVDFVHREVLVECLPGDIPNHLELDVTELRVGEHVEASALQLPDGVTLADEGERVIVSLGHGRLEEGAAAPGGEALLEADRAEPEVIKRRKAEE
jgi:large subunit ribosomal protein L25